MPVLVPPASRRPKKKDKNTGCLLYCKQTKPCLPACLPTSTVYHLTRRFVFHGAPMTRRINRTAAFSGCSGRSPRFRPQDGGRLASQPRQPPGHQALRDGALDGWRARDALRDGSQGVCGQEGNGRSDGPDFIHRAPRFPLVCFVVAYDPGCRIVSSRPHPRMIKTCFPCMINLRVRYQDLKVSGQEGDGRL